MPFSLRSCMQPLRMMCFETFKALQEKCNALPFKQNAGNYWTAIHTCFKQEIRMASNHWLRASKQITSGRDSASHVHL